MSSQNNVRKYRTKEHEQVFLAPNMEAKVHFRLVHVILYVISRRYFGMILQYFGMEIYYHLLFSKIYNYKLFINHYLSFLG